MDKFLNIDAYVKFHDAAQGVTLAKTMPHTIAATVLAVASLTLAGCGMCTEETLDEHTSPGGLYSVAVVSSDCVGTSKSQQVVLRKLAGAFRDKRAVAIFDDSDADNPADISVNWLKDEKLVIHGHGAKVWSFQPDWHTVHVEAR